jgi:hypothetical protein
MGIKHAEDVAMYPVPLLDNPQGPTCEAGWEPRSDLSFPSPNRMMVRLGLAPPHVQPCPRIHFFALVIPVARDDKTLEVVFLGSGSSGLLWKPAGPVAQVARAHP